MIKIQPPTNRDIPNLVSLARQTFLESHGTSASALDLQNYMRENYTQEAFEEELANPACIYHLLYSNHTLVGYSKIVFNYSHKNIAAANITKLERIYILESHHGKGLGEQLFQFNVDLAKRNDQSGVWLFTWIANKRAIRFYEKMNFKIVGRHDFRISDTHSNPNHQLYLSF